MPWSIPEPRPAISVSAVLFSVAGSRLSVWLQPRTEGPQEGAFELPEAFLAQSESLVDASLRAFSQCPHWVGATTEQLRTHGEVDRDPRERVITVVYSAVIAAEAPPAGAPADEPRWFDLKSLPPMAIDHRLLLDEALEELRKRTRLEPIGRDLLPPKFTLSQLQQLQQTVLGQPLDKRNFRKRLFSLDLLEEVGEVQQGVRHRAARLYRFKGKGVPRTEANPETKPVNPSALSEPSALSDPSALPEPMLQDPNDASTATGRDTTPAGDESDAIGQLPPGNLQSPTTDLPETQTNGPEHVH